MFKIMFKIIYDFHDLLIVFVDISQRNNIITQFIRAHHPFHLFFR